MKNFITRNRLIRISAIIVLVLIWKLISMWAGSDHIFPSPEKTLLAVADVISRDTFWPSLFSTLGRGLLGFVISVFLALIIGIPSGISSDLFLFVNPLLITMRSIPIISLILLAIIWIGNQWVPVFIAVLTMFPILCINIIDGIGSVDHDLVEMSRTYRISKSRIISGIYLPSISPFLTAGISNAIGFGWRAIIVGEVLAQPHTGIGTQMQNAQIFLQVSELIAWTLVAIIVSSIFESLIRIAEKKLVHWK